MMERKIICDLHLITVDLDERKSSSQEILFALPSAPCKWTAYRYDRRVPGRGWTFFHWAWSNRRLSSGSAYCKQNNYLRATITVITGAAPNGSWWMTLRWSRSRQSGRLSAKGATSGYRNNIRRSSWGSVPIGNMRLFSRRLYKIAHP